MMNTKKAEEEYDELAGLIDRMDDVSYVIGDYMNGAIAGMKEFVEGMWGLFKGGWEIEIWAGLKGAEALGLGFTVSESLDEDVTRIFQTGAAIISDPINMLGAVIQGMFDSADENSTAYTAGHLTADIAIAIAMDKGVGKLKELLKSGRLSMSDALTKWIKRVKSKIKGGSRSAQGLTGRDFEKYLTDTLGGEGSFSVGGREFDGGVGNRWWEAKSGNYWDMLEDNPSMLAKFKSDMGNRLRIATDNGATYELFSNTSIPESIKKWLMEKRYSFYRVIRLTGGWNGSINNIRLQ